MTKFLENHFFAVVLLAFLLILSIVVLNTACRSTMDRVEWQRETYRVQRGDSLWAISRDYCPDNVDRREWIDEIQSINGLTSSTVYPGQKLIVLAPRNGG